MHIAIATVALSALRPRVARRKQRLVVTVTQPARDGVIAPSRAGKGYHVERDVVYAFETKEAHVGTQVAALECAHGGTFRGSRCAYGNRSRPQV